MDQVAGKTLIHEWNPLKTTINHMHQIQITWMVHLCINVRLAWSMERNFRGNIMTERGRPQQLDFCGVLRRSAPGSNQLSTTKSMAARPIVIVTLRIYNVNTLNTSSPFRRNTINIKAGTLRFNRSRIHTSEHVVVARWSKAWPRWTNESSWSSVAYYYTSSGFIHLIFRDLLNGNTPALKTFKPR